MQQRYAQQIHQNRIQMEAKQIKQQQHNYQISIYMPWGGGKDRGWIMLPDVKMWIVKIEIAKRKMIPKKQKIVDPGMFVCLENTMKNKRNVAQFGAVDFWWKS